jgi:ribonucleoside-diphosphate reductase beta chain
MMLNWDDPIAQFKQTGQPNPAETMVDEKVLNIDQESEKSSALSEDKVISEHATAEDKATIKPENIQEQGVTGLEKVQFGAGRLAVDDKAMINCRSDVNQLVPFK